MLQSPLERFTRRNKVNEVIQREYEMIFRPRTISPVTPFQMRDFQIERLKYLNLAEYRDFDFLYRCIPKKALNFIFVPPRGKEIDLDYLTSLIKVNGAHGLNLAGRETEWSHKVRFPKSAFLMLDVDDGDRNLGIDPISAFTSLKKERRMPYTIYPGLIHAILFPAFFSESSNGMWFSASRLTSRLGDGKVADLWLSEGKPKLDWYWAISSIAGWGSASCLRIITP